MTAHPRRPIRRLGASTVGRIAAGEVVERPASVVKELVENAIDAGAHHISVRLEGGGLERIVVADDGGGIPAEELALALERYATSKLSDDAELSALGTLGFRGEALAAIGAVAHVTLTSRVGEAGAAARIEVHGGDVGRPEPAARSVGTTVEVRDLFYNVPARRKFLKSPASEQVETTALVDRLYLARPDVGLSLEANGSTVARYPPTDDLRAAATYALGAEFGESCLPVEVSEPGVRIEGWIGRPPLGRSTAAGLFLSVNGRSVQVRGLSQAVRVAYAEYLPRTRFPVGVLRLTLDPSRLDVNVHPTKREIRIAREGEIAELILRAVREALRAAPHAALAPGPAAAPEPPMVPVEPADDLEPVSAVFAPALHQLRFEGASEPRSVAASPRHPALELLGCLGALYWVAGSGPDLVLVDQHAASERVVYAELRARGRLARQELVQPVRVELTPRQLATLRSEAATVEQAGYSVEPFGPTSFRVHAVPIYRGRMASVEELPRLLDELADGGRPSVPDGLEERVAASVACHAAVRAGDAISVEEMGRLLEELYALPDAAFACPHGRPILIRLPRSRLDRWFGRSGA
jgi:DNA mismatch repair protein MutL